MAGVARPLHRRREYLAADRSSRDTKLEYVDGEILAMTGVAPRHNAVTVNTSSALAGRLRGRCTVC
jgi:hypothetical protein